MDLVSKLNLLHPRMQFESCIRNHVVQTRALFDSGLFV